MSDAPTFPNSFQTPNIYVDAALEFITGDECKVLIFAIRHILGWRERQHQAQISLTRFEKGYTSEKGYYFGGCGLSRPTLIAVLDELVRYGLLVKVGKATNKGQWWQLGESPDWDGLKARHESRKTANQKRTTQARQKHPRKSRPPAQVVNPINQSVVSPTNQPVVNGTDQPVVSPTNQPVVNGTDQPVVSPTNQQRLVPLTDTGQSDLPNKNHLQNHHQTQSINPPAADVDADNIFTLYQKAFGDAEFAKAMKSEMLRDELKDMQAEYPMDWIESVFRDAAMRYPTFPISYCLKILKGKSEEKMRQEAAAAVGTNGNGHHPTPAPKPVYTPPAGLETEYAAWAAALTQLELQLDRANFDTWLHDAEFVAAARGVPAADPGTEGLVTRFTIRVKNEYAVLNLQHRLYRTVKRVLRDVYSAPVEIVFIEKQNAPESAGHLALAGNEQPAQ